MSRRDRDAAGLTRRELLVGSAAAAAVVADDGLGGMPDDDVDVVWEVAADDRFSELTAGGVAVAAAEHAHRVHLDASTATWNLIGNPVVLAGVDGGNAADGSAYYLDSWDGYPTARHRFIHQLARIDNPVVLTGDYHAGMLLDVHERPFEVDSALVAPELMAPPISSPLFPADVSGRTPQLRHQINGHGYLKVEIIPEVQLASFEVHADVSDPDSAIAPMPRVRIAAGSPEAIVEAAPQPA